MFGIMETGIEAITIGQLVMIGVGLVLMYLAIEKDMEPYELLPLSIGMILTNLPYSNIMPSTIDIFEKSLAFQDLGLAGPIWNYGIYLWPILPPLLFMGIGAMTDFDPLLSQPKTFLLGIAAQFGVFVAFIGALSLNFTDFASLHFSLGEAASIGIIGSANGPATIFTASQLAPRLIAITAVAAYSYMAMVAIIQPPIIKGLTSKEERQLVMKSKSDVSKTEKVLFPIISLILIILFVPEAAPLLGMFMMGNLFRESGVVDRLQDTTGGSLMNIVTILLIFSVGASASAGVMLKFRTLIILGLGLAALGLGTSFGVLSGKLMNALSSEKINPMIGAAGLSAVPMSARNVQKLGREANQRNDLLMHAMGPNVAGVVGSVTVAGIFLGMI